MSSTQKAEKVKIRYIESQKCFEIRYQDGSVTTVKLDDYDATHLRGDIENSHYFAIVPFNTESFQIGEANKEIFLISHGFVLNTDNEDHLTSIGRVYLAYPPTGMWFHVISFSTKHP